MQTLHSTLHTSHLTIHTDGGSRGNPGPAATGVVIRDESGAVIHEFGTYIGIATNNEAEYLAVIDALKWITSDYFSLVKGDPGVTPGESYPPLSFLLDSKLVVEQIERRWKIKESRLFELASKIWESINSHQLHAEFSHIPRELNADADGQVNKVLDAQSII